MFWGYRCAPSWSERVSLRGTPGRVFQAGKIADYGGPVVAPLGYRARTRASFLVFLSFSSLWCPTQAMAHLISYLNLPICLPILHPYHHCQLGQQLVKSAFSSPIFSFVIWTKLTVLLFCLNPSIDCFCVEINGLPDFCFPPWSHFFLLCLPYINTQVTLKRFDSPSFRRGSHLCTHLLGFESVCNILFSIFRFHSVYPLGLSLHICLVWETSCPFPLGQVFSLRVWQHPVFPSSFSCHVNVQSTFIFLNLPPDCVTTGGK